MLPGVCASTTVRLDRARRRKRRLWRDTTRSERCVSGGWGGGVMVVGGCDSYFAALWQTLRAHGRRAVRNSTQSRTVDLAHFATVSPPPPHLPPPSPHPPQRSPPASINNDEVAKWTYCQQDTVEPHRRTKTRAHTGTYPHLVVGEPVSPLLFRLAAPPSVVFPSLPLSLSRLPLFFARSSKRR